MTTILFQVTLNVAQQRNIHDAGDEQENGADGPNCEGEEHGEDYTRLEDVALVILIRIRAPID